MEKETENELFVVRTRIGREGVVADIMEKRARENDDISIKGVLVPWRISGYIITEAGDLGAVERAIDGIRPARSVMEKKMPPKDLEAFFEPKVTVAGMERGRKVMVTEGGFKGKKGRIMEVDRDQEKVTVEIEGGCRPASRHDKGGASQGHRGEVGVGLRSSGFLESLIDLQCPFRLEQFRVECSEAVTAHGKSP